MYLEGIQARRNQPMVLELNPVTVWNIIFTSVIFILGMVGYHRTRNQASIFIGLAFGLFAFSHLVTLFGYAQQLELLLLTVRTFGYCSVIYALVYIGFMTSKTSP